MSSLERGRGRVARGLTLSAACLAVPTIAHVIASGGLPAIGPFLFAAGLLSTACVALADRRLTAGGIAALLFGSQPVFHILLSLSTHGHASSATPGVGMVIGHTVAAGALTVLLAGGESVLWSMAALSAVLFRRRLRIPALPTLAPGPDLPSPFTDDAANRYVLLISQIAPRRGPPLLSSV
ncbi:MAG TPA: hypothetical protein VFI46_18090 [Jiangellaceae bacterium]|nr:hypothetical protein [Jiangellaceae bacterium]